VIVSDGYSLIYDETHNRIVINIPPTMATATDTVTPIADRRTDVSETDLTVLLNIAQLIFLKTERTVWKDGQLG
jgi:hypothetical protein